MVNVDGKELLHDNLQAYDVRGLVEYYKHEDCRHLTTDEENVLEELEQLNKAAQGTKAYALYKQCAELILPNYLNTSAFYNNIWKVVFEPLKIANAFFAAKAKFL